MRQQTILPFLSDVCRNTSSACDQTDHPSHDRSRLRAGCISRRIERTVIPAVEKPCSCRPFERVRGPVRSGGTVRERVQTPSRIRLHAEKTRVTEEHGGELFPRDPGVGIKAGAVPFTIPASAAQTTASAYQALSFTSEKGFRAMGADDPSRRHRTVASIARVRVPSGAKVSSVTPAKSSCAATKPISSFAQ